MEKHASLSGYTDASSQAPVLTTEFWHHVALPHLGEHSPQELGSSRSPPHPKGSCSSKPEMRVLHTAYQLAAFIRQNGKSHCCGSCSGDPPFKHTTSQVFPSLSHCPSFSRAPGSLARAWPLGHLSPCLLSRPEHSCPFERANPACEIFSHVCKVEKKKEESKSYLQLKPKKLNLLLGKRLPPGTGFAVPSSEKQSKCRNKRAGLWPPGWPARGGSRAEPHEGHWLHLATLQAGPEQGAKRCGHCHPPRGRRPRLPEAPN